MLQVPVMLQTYSSRHPHSLEPRHKVLTHTSGRPPRAAAASCTTPCHYPATRLVRMHRKRSTRASA